MPLPSGRSVDQAQPSRTSALAASHKPAQPAHRSIALNSVQPGKIRIGIAGWSVPATYRASESVTSQLARYATYFDCVEINSSFHKLHRAASFARWADAVPPDFRFATKLSRVITHERRLVSCADDVNRFCVAVAGLRDKLGALLVQLPPSLVFDQSAATATFGQLKYALTAIIVCEARHPSWFQPDVDQFFREWGITRVFADPPVDSSLQPVVAAESFSYLRLHGQARRYYSAYSLEYLAALAARLRPAAAGAGAWCIFDNTASGAAWPNALQLKEDLAHPAPKG
jgi:uncharacterized protein YecE (DUF72 family)